MLFRSQHVWVDVSETGPLADCSDPAMRRPSVKPLAIMAEQDRAVAPFADREVHGACGPGHERDYGWLAALAEDPQRPMSTIEAEISDFGVARLAHPQAVQSEQHSELDAS